jgi:hypothetical protein
MDERRYKHLRNFIKEEVSETPENDAQKELDDLLLTERKYFTLRPDEEVYISHNKCSLEYLYAAYEI